jgi:hypothetical protein
MGFGGCDSSLGLFLAVSISFVAGLLFGPLVFAPKEDARFNGAIETKTAIIRARPFNPDVAVGLLQDALVAGSEATVDGNTGLAKRESLGWFDEADALWEYRKTHAKTQLLQRDTFPRTPYNNLMAKGVSNNALFQFNFRPVMVNLLPT